MRSKLRKALYSVEVKLREFKPQRGPRGAKDWNPRFTMHHGSGNRITLHHSPFQGYANPSHTPYKSIL
jgi:hypothetical protein